MEILSKSIPGVVQFFPIFLTIYTISILYIFPHWSSKSRPKAASCLISLSHGIPILFMAPLSLLHDQNPTFASPNTRFQNGVLDYSIAYFTMDLIHYIVFYPDDIIFILHHLATLFVFITCRYLVSHGALGILVLLILAEVTSVLQNIWTLARVRREENEFAAKVYGFLSPPFYTLYSVVRGSLGPWFVYRMGAFFVSGVADDVIPRWVWGSWLVVVVVAIAVSILWIWNLWVELFREKLGRRKRKVR